MSTALDLNNASRPIVGIHPDDDRDERREAAYADLIKSGFLPDGRDVSVIHEAFLGMEQGELLELADAVNDANYHKVLSAGKRIGVLLNRCIKTEIDKVVT